MLNRTDKVLLALTFLICIWALAGCDKDTPNEDAPLNAHVAQVEAEKQLRDARLLVNSTDRP